jgi:hypothetical protein
MEPTYTAETETERLEVYVDETPLDPRKEFDNVGKMVCFHRRYSLGDKHNFQSPEDFKEWYEENKEDIAVILPLYLYDHSGITMRTSSFGDPWDSGQVGYIYCTKAQTKEEWGNYYPDETEEQINERARKYLIGEVETYDQYLTGQVYGYRLFSNAKLYCTTCGQKTEEDAEKDACWGFYGDPKESMKGNVPDKLLEALA